MHYRNPVQPPALCSGNAIKLVWMAEGGGIHLFPESPPFLLYKGQTPPQPGSIAYRREYGKPAQPVRLTCVDYVGQSSAKSREFRADYQVDGVTGRLPAQTGQRPSRRVHPAQAQFPSCDPPCPGQICCSDGTCVDFVNLCPKSYAPSSGGQQPACAQGCTFMGVDIYGKPICDCSGGRPLAVPDSGAGSGGRPTFDDYQSHRGGPIPRQTVFGGRASARRGGGVGTGPHPRPPKIPKSCKKACSGLKPQHQQECQEGCRESVLAPKPKQQGRVPFRFRATAVANPTSHGGACNLDDIKAGCMTVSYPIGGGDYSNYCHCIKAQGNGASTGAVGGLSPRPAGDSGWGRRGYATVDPAPAKPKRQQYFYGDPGDIPVSSAPTKSKPKRRRRRGRVQTRFI